MLHVLNRHDWRVKRLLAREGLKSPEFLGKGAFALTYRAPQPDRVIKLTADHLTASYLRDYTAPKGMHVPRVFGDVDVVGEIEDVDIYRIEMERLNPLPRSGANRRLARQLWNAYPDRKSLGDASVSDDAFADMPKSLQKFLHELSWFCDNYQNVELDIHSQNLIERANSTLVFADPVCDTKLMAKLARLSNNVSEHARRTGRAFYRTKLH